ncbi:uncharacterized protein RJT20DRAFT_503 [Scheffersomyces xylosifermentans]|uniref:uncharacterized protein n=1 Tax=Scheffersomyces xylosifermentans TaxID=1304137 RepID=UPI00315CF62E
MVTKVFFICINYLPIFQVNNRFLLDSLNYFIQNFFNLNIFLISLYSYVDTTSDQLFLMNLKFVDKILSTDYHDNLVRLPNDTIRVMNQQPASASFLQKSLFLFKNSSHFKDFLKRYCNYYLFNVGIFLLITFPSKFSSLVLGLISFQIFSDKLGTVPSILMISALNLLPYHYTAALLTTFYGSSNLSYDLLSPYFHRLNMSNYEKKHWINNRNGVLFGFGLVNFWTINTFPQFAVVLYALAQMNMAYLLTKITDTPPKQQSKLISWTSSQLLWTDKYSLINGDFVNDPFMAIPGSFIFQ